MPSPYWADLGEGVVAAVVLLVSGDPETWRVTRQSLVISLTATVPSVVLGVPLGIWIALSSFRGRALILTGFNTGFGLPPVVVGLVLSILLLRDGPLGWLNLRFTPTATVVAQFILSSRTGSCNHDTSGGDLGDAGVTEDDLARALP